MDPLFLTLDEVLEIHAQQAHFYGGAEALRDSAALELAAETKPVTAGAAYSNID